ncbi:hypothetical protein L1987_79604 [Smallanthus sonchifolius]|uniref:Uncharacterized protein n=1 Tax=Smallanthus sonchifolius TaxID=185202 RepID=A0ACB8YLI9_9ASTR|nr:hypothetical protein L1987_79604 [Smallanthus sonchifolius]
MARTLSGPSASPSPTSIPDAAEEVEDDYMLYEQFPDELYDRYEFEELDDNVKPNELEQPDFVPRDFENEL